MRIKNLTQALHTSILQNSSSVAFSINGIFYTYAQVAQRVAHIQLLIQNHDERIDSCGIIANQDFDTYCTIVACLLSGVTYIPIEPGHPDERNNHIINITGVKVIFCSNMSVVTSTLNAKHETRFILLQQGEKHSADLKLVHSKNPVYILFTSGSTGLPKGVPISTDNLLAFVNNVDAMHLGITPQSKFLQVFDLTFDLSVFSYLVPLLKGSSVILLAKSSLKYTHAIQLIEDENITHILTVPSFINYLRKYFGEISLPCVQHWLFCGEALKSDLVYAWQPCIPNATIHNVYGPTEATIFCSSFACKPGSIKEMNGIICIGKPFAGTILELSDENGIPALSNKSGELYIAGSQLTSGYVNNAEKNRIAFSKLNGNLYYHSGDICLKDADGNFFFTGRNDSQVKVQGYRVELGEIEYYASLLPEIDEAVVIAVMKGQQQVLHLFYTTRQNPSEQEINTYLASKLPAYMVPSYLTRIKEIPYNLNGKIDKLVLQQLSN